VVDRTGQHAPELRGPNAALEGGSLGGGLFDGRFVVLGRAELEQDRRVVEIACQLLDRADMLLERRALAGDGLRFLLVVPETGRERLLLEAVDLGLQLRQVKDAPLAP
jgi:hypothetical protein